MPIDAYDNTQAVSDKATTILRDIEIATREFAPWQDYCDTVDAVYSACEETLADVSGMLGGLTDSRLDIFWASVEVIKPAIYARKPVPAVAARFKDGNPLYSTTAEMLERSAIQVFDHTGINDVMMDVRDDLIFAGRGAPWVILDGDKICIEHADRRDFLHEPARYWREVGWVAKRSWLSKDEAIKRFGKKAKRLTYTLERDKQSPSAEVTKQTTSKVGIWEVWHRADNMVYWVTEGFNELLDSGKPHLELSGFFPCPRPAYGSLRRRSLVPVPDYHHYMGLFEQINEATAKIYALLREVRLAGFMGGSGDVGAAIADLMNSTDTLKLIEVPNAALAGGVGDSLVWLPLLDIMQTITGLIEARNVLIDNYYQLSGISDIMRGATEAEETLGAQQLKSHYGSVRVKDKVTELQRVAADLSRIIAEILSEKFTGKQLNDMSGMEVPTKADIVKQTKAIENAAAEELKALQAKFDEGLPQFEAQMAQIDLMAEQDPEGAEQARQEAQQQAEQAKQQFAEAQQQIYAKYAPQFQQLEAAIPIEAVMELLRDDKARSFAFEVETDSTILADEMSEKASRNEFLAQFSNSTQSLMALMTMGEEGAQLSGEMLRFALAPYRAGRSLQEAIDNFIDAAPELAKAAQAQAGEDGTEGLAEAQKALAEAEMTKAQAAIQKVQADSQLKQAELQGKMQQMQLDAAEKEGKFMLENGKLELAMQKQQQEFTAKMAEIEAKTNLMQAQTAKLLSDIGLDVQRQNLEEYKAVEASQQQQVDNERAMMGEQRAERGEDRADRSQQFGEQQATNQQKGI